MNAQSAENDARSRAVVAAVNLAEAWVEFWDSVTALGEATRVTPPDEWDNWPLSAYLPRVIPPATGTDPSSASLRPDWG